MKFTKKEFNEQAESIVQYFNSAGRSEWQYDKRGIMIRTCDLGEPFVNYDVDEEIIEDPDDDIVITTKQRYTFTHHILFNNSYQVPQFGLNVFDNKENKYITHQNEMIALIKSLNDGRLHGETIPDNSDPINMFVTFDEHPLIRDLYMFFIHPCGTSKTISTVVQNDIQDYLICYLSSYGSDVCCFENWKEVQCYLLHHRQQQ